MVVPLGMTSPGLQLRMIAGVLGLLLVAWAAARPGPALIALVVFLPFQVHALAALHRLGVPAEALRSAGFAKEGLVAGIVVAALRHAVARGQRLDGVDRVALAFSALVLVYLLIPLLAEPVVGVIFDAAPRGWYPQALAVRSNLGPVLVLLAVRSLALPDAWRRRIVGVVIAVAVVTALGGIIEFFFNDLWQRFEGEVLRFGAYHDAVGLETPPAAVESVILGRSFKRAGSFLSQLTLGFFLLSGMCLQLVRTSQGLSPRRMFVVSAIVLGGLVTLTRSAVLSLMIAAVVTAWLSRSSGPSQRSRLLAMSVVILAISIAAANETGLTGRTLAAVRGDDPSATGHVDRSSEALRLALAHPLGQGLGVQSGVAARTGGEQVPAENAYLQLAHELGLVGSLLFVWMLWRLILSLSRRRDEPLAAGSAGALAGAVVGGLFLHVWTDLPTSWTLMLVAGLALPRATPDAITIGKRGPLRVGTRQDVPAGAVR